MRTKDRLAEFLERAGQNGKIVEKNNVSGEEKDSSHCKELQETFDQVERTRNLERELHHATIMLRALHADPTFHNNPDMQDRAEMVARRATTIGTELCSMLRLMSSKAQIGGGGAAARISTLHAVCCRRRASSLFEQHYAELDIIRTKRRTQLKRQLALTNLEMSEEECENLLDTNNISIFVDNIKEKTESAKIALRSAEARKAELAKVEKSLVEVRDLFALLAEHVVAQQDQFDTVEQAAVAAGRQVDAGRDELLQGKVRKSSARKKKLSLIICLASGIAIVLLVLVAT